MQYNIELRERGQVIVSWRNRLGDEVRLVLNGIGEDIYSVLRQIERRRLEES